MIDAKGNEITTDKDSGMLQMACDDAPDTPNNHDGHCRAIDWMWDEWQDTGKSSTETTGTGDGHDDRIIEASQKEAKPTGINTSFYRLCRNKNIPMELNDLYYHWLTTVKVHGSPITDKSALPENIHDKGQFVRPGIRLPSPTGRLWEQMMREKNMRYSKFNEKHIVAANVALLQSQEHCYQLTRQARIAATQTETNHAHKAKKSRQQAVAADDSKTPPKGIISALRHEDTAEAYKWLESINKEWDGLQELGVFEHDCTLEDLRSKGIYTSPCPFSICLTYKYDQHGNIDRYKTRFALAGHSGNLQKGIHFDKTFSATPNQHTSRLLQALMVKHKMFRLAMDIKMAYCNANMPNDQLISVRYPTGFTRKHPETGEELFMILRKNLYGHPAAGKHWQDERNKVILETFNTQGWTCHKCVKDPCLFVLSRTIEGVTARTYMLIHTDDIDMISEREGDLQEVHRMLSKKWECKIIDPSYVLGVKRHITMEGDRMCCELTMTAFVEGMYSSFREHANNRTAYTPMPDNTYIYLNPKTTDHEADRVLDRGYQRLFGMILWAARGVYPECLQGASMLGRVLSRPTEEAFRAAIHMMKYMYANRNRGLRYTSDDCGDPIAYVDASNKADPTDSKCMFGYCITWQGAAVISYSKKLCHVGLSAGHNEYMALHWVNRHTCWLRDLLREMGLPITEATVTYADNTAANLLSEEDIITMGNQFIRTPYHFTKECVADKIVEVKHIPTEDNLADIFTKSVSRQVLERLLPYVTGYWH